MRDSDTNRLRAWDQRARAHSGLGYSYRAVGDPVRAQHDFQRARSVYDELGVPEPEGQPSLAAPPRCSA